jgi:hypoxanthine phosphoribosyltransferase
MTILDKEFEILIGREDIDQTIAQLARRLDTDYKGKRPLFLAILNGAFIFAADLFRAISVDAEISFIRLASYKKMQSSGKVKELLGLQENIFNRHIVIVEDIVDTGNTLHHVLEEFSALGAASIQIATMLHKPEAGAKSLPLKYIGFTIPDKFVVGYGLDYEGHGRGLRDIFQVK